ncbi:MAG: SMI1/KNR4 family protein [Veillonella sp.]|nr:SMI1/KNR4 family protein [Veillonella sp.]
MFKLKLLPEDFFNICIKRKVEIKKLDKLPKLDNNYLLFIVKYQEVEIIPDISLFNYEEALNENRYLECNYPEIDNTIFHYNHDAGEYTRSGFTNLGIDFSQFIQLALLYRDLEHLLDEGERLTDNIKTEFIYSVNSISNTLFNVYPFKYF